jgi:hypothetical protein
MNLLQNGTFIGKITSLERSASATATSSDHLQQPPTHRDIFELVLQPPAHFQFSKDAQYAIAQEGKADQSIAIIAWSGNAIKYRHN